MFQFYDSPIKSAFAVNFVNEFRKFQFYDSPIKSLLRYIRQTRRPGFQFYDSPIKSMTENGCAAGRPCFNSMIVRLKDNIDAVNIPFSIDVSIL